MIDEENQIEQKTDEAKSETTQPSEKQTGFMERVATVGRSVVKRIFPGVPPASERPSVTLEKMYEVGIRFSEKIFGIPEISEKLKASSMILQMEYYDPENWGEDKAQVTIDCTQEPIKLYTGPCDLKPIVIMRMHADTAHRFWMQKANLMVSITRKEIQAIGPIPQVMKLIPILKPGYPLYKQTLQELALFDLLAYPAEKEELSENKQNT